jgi:hypothetical protein
LRMAVARLGPRRRGLASSVMPGSSAAPFFTTTAEEGGREGGGLRNGTLEWGMIRRNDCAPHAPRLRTERSLPTMQPRTDLRLRSPVRRGR